MKTRNKYGAKKAKCFSKHTHDSKKEAEYCNVLLAKKFSKEIKSYDTQVSFTLLSEFRFQGKNIQPVTYIADFVIKHKDGTVEIIDVKGVQTQTFRIKWKLLKHKLKNEGDYKLTIV